MWQFCFKPVHIASIKQYVDNLFHSFIVLCDNEYFLMSNLHWSINSPSSVDLAYRESGSLMFKQVGYG